MRKTRQQRFSIGLIGVLLSCMIPLACTRSSVKEAQERAREEKEDNELPEVVVRTFEKQELYETLSYSGTISAKQQRSVYAPLPGLVNEIKVPDGGFAKKDQTLLVIKPDAEGLEFRDHVIRAPQDGVVIARFVKTGTHIDRNQELLTVGDLSGLKVEVSATLEDLQHLRKDQNVEVWVYNSQEKEAPLKGVIKFIPGSPDAKTKTFPVSISISCEIKNNCHRAYPGLLARITVKKHPHEGFKIPFKYLRRQKSHLLVAKDDDTATFIEVEVGQHYGQDVEILKGITAQTRIITSFSKMPQEGQKVKLSSAGVPDKFSEK